jgi:uroporphyrinogen-III synthase
VLLTRSADDNADWARELLARGFAPIECACLVEHRLDDEVDIARELEVADWITCSSRRAVDALDDATRQIPARVRLAAIGPATEERMRELFGRCDCTSQGGSAADLGAELVRLGAQHVLVTAARGGLFDIERVLMEAGRRATRVELYEIQPLAGELPVEVLDADTAFFASPSAVRAFSARGALPAGCTVVSIGPTTTAALRDAGLPVHIESRTRDLSGMISALATLSTSER